MEKIIWHTEKRKVKDLIETECNPRKISKEQLKQLKKSIEKFNLADIPVINLDNRIISGHQRIRILKILGRGDEEIDVRVPNRQLTEEEHREYLLRANKNTGDWDFNVLANFDSELLLDVGFEKDELSDIFDFNLETNEDEFDVEKELEEIKTDIKQGDLFELDEHRLLCGDATDENDVKKLMGDKKADIIFTDPPYGVMYSSRGNKTLTKSIKNDNLENLDVLLSKSFKNFYDFTKDDVAGYIWHADQKDDCILIFMNAIKKCKFKIYGKIVWVKNNASMGFNDYRYKYESCFYIKKGKPKFYGDRTNTNVWEVKRDTKYEHPTQKPIKLAEIALLNSSCVNDICIDFFLGSGSTLIACEQLKRKCYGIELDPVYCQLIINRWEKFTGKKAKKVK